MINAHAGPEINRSALIIVDMQNDFVHPEGGFARLAQERPEAQIDMMARIFANVKSVDEVIALLGQS